MNKEELLEMLTAEIKEDYFPNQYRIESELLSNKEENSKPQNPISSDAYKNTSPASIHALLKIYIQLSEEKALFWTWPIDQAYLGFDLVANELDFIENHDKFFVLATDPRGDFYVITKDSEEISLCDHNTGDLYDGWDSFSQWVAWAMRVAIFNTNTIVSKEEILDYWETRNNRIDSKTLERIIDEVLQ